MRGSLRGHCSERTPSARGDLAGTPGAALHCPSAAPGTRFRDRSRRTPGLQNWNQLLNQPSGTDASSGRRDLLMTCLGALGIVYGDIGTSPIYAIRESFHESYGIAPTQANVLGILSLIFWALIVVISVKYLVFVMRADNRGEGGIIALTALVSSASERPGRTRTTLVLAGLFGAALLYGDSMITPAISVLSAIEGLEVATPFFRPFVIPITVIILLALFLFQSRGTERVGRIFGPVTLLWFLALATLGLNQLVRNPSVLQALWPGFGVRFFLHNGLRGFFVLGSVFLVVTGGEALYSDMGHFGRRPIRLTWFYLVLPALLLNYFGQGALVLEHPAALQHPFFLMAPEWALYPLVVLGTAATVIASQAVISGAFSLTRQAVQLGYLPRLGIEYTSEKRIGQIYIPFVNWLLLAACVGLVLGFRASTRLADAYGVAVTTDMVFTTVLFAVAARSRFGWSAWRMGWFVAALIVVDLAFWGANLPKIPHGGWFPLLVAATMFTVMTTWKKGRALLGRQLARQVLPLDLFLANVREHPPLRVPGTAVYMFGRNDGTPPALLHNLKHNKVLHERVLFLSVVTREVPTVPDSDRAEVDSLGEGIFRMTVQYGFAEDPDIPAALKVLERQGLRLRMAETSFFLGREKLIVRKGGWPMVQWREHLFSLLSRNAQSATAYFRIPPNRVVELGMQIQI